MINLLPGIESTSAALSAERIRMAVASQNIANAEGGKGPDGKTYQRQQVVFESVMAKFDANSNGIPAQKVQVARVEKDQRPPRLIFDPDNSEADQNGMVEVPNVNIHEEMADMIVSSRAYEANLAVVRNARAMVAQTLNIGKR